MWCLAARKESKQQCLTEEVVGGGFSGWFRCIRFLGASSEQPEAAMWKLQWSGQSWSLPRCNFLTGIECITRRERMRCSALSFELFWVETVLKGWRWIFLKLRCTREFLMLNAKQVKFNFTSHTHIQTFHSRS